MPKLPKVPPTTTTLAIRLVDSVERSRQTQRTAFILVLIPAPIALGLLPHDD